MYQHWLLQQQAVSETTTWGNLLISKPHRGPGLSLVARHKLKLTCWGGHTNSWNSVTVRTIFTWRVFPLSVSTCFSYSANIQLCPSELNWKFKCRITAKLWSQNCGPSKTLVPSVIWIWTICHCMKVTCLRWILVPIEVSQNALFGGFEISHKMSFVLLVCFLTKPKTFLCFFVLSSSIIKQWTGPQTFTGFEVPLSPKIHCFLVVLSVLVWNKFNEKQVLLVFNCEKLTFDPLLSFSYCWFFENAI